MIKWVYDLYGRSGASMAGLLPLSYTTIRDWAATLDIRLEPYEVEALIVLDSVLFTEGEPDKEEEVTLPVAPLSKWPESKAPK